MSKFDHIFIAPKDWDASLQFYQNKLGYEEVSSWGDKSEGRGSVLKMGSFTVVIAEEHENKGDNSWVAGYNEQRPTVHINVEDVDKAFDNIKDKEAVVIKPEDNHWAGRWMVVKDPDDNLIAYNTPKEN